MEPLLAVNEDDISFEILFHQNPQPMWILDVTTFKFLLVNQAAIKHYGYGFKEFSSLTLDKIEPASEQKSMRNLFKRIKHNQTIKKDIRHVKKTGEIIYVHITSYNVIFHSRECRMVVLNDVTEMLRKDAEISSMLNRLYQTLDSVTDGFITLNNNWKVTYFNKEAERFFGFTKNGKHNSEILRSHAWGIADLLAEKLNNALQTGQTEKFEILLPAVQKWLNISAYPDKDGLTIYFQDVTDHKNNLIQITEKDKNLKVIAYINSHVVRKHIANIMGIVNAVGDDPENSDDLVTPMRMLKASAEELDRVIMLVNSQVEQVNK